MRHRKRMSITKTKTSVKHGSTLLDNTGPGVGSLFAHLVANTKAGNRNSSGAPEVLKTEISTDETCAVGDTIKYVNICIECSPRGADSTNIKDDCGWLEWGLIWQVEEADALAVTNIGTDTLGVLLNRSYRNNCIYTGCFPLGARQAMSQDLKFKIPPRMQKLTLGYRLVFFCYARGSSSTDTRTDSYRLLVSSQFKAYT